MNIQDNPYYRPYHTHAADRRDRRDPQSAKPTRSRVPRVHCLEQRAPNPTQGRAVTRAVSRVLDTRKKPGRARSKPKRKFSRIEGSCPSPASKLPKTVGSFNLAQPECSETMVSVFRQLRSEARYKPITQLAPQTQQRMVETVKESGLAEGIELRFHPKYQWGAFVSAGKTIHRRTMIGMYTGRYKVENAEKHKSRKRDCSYDFELSAAPILLSDSERESLREEGHLVPTKAKVKPDDGYDVYVDASTQGNFTRFFNHSANPNCDQEYHWADFGKGPVLVVVYRARFDITGPCPVTIDYGKPYWKGQGFDPVELPWQDFKRMT